MTVSKRAGTSIKSSDNAGEGHKFSYKLKSYDYKVFLSLSTRFKIFWLLLVNATVFFLQVHF